MSVINFLNSFINKRENISDLLSLYIEEVIMPKKGKKNKEEKAEESAPIFKKLRNKDLKWVYAALLGLGILNLVYGVFTRPIWGISKIQGTPSWLAICTGIGFILFALLYYIADQKKITSWAKIIAPAGTATLTCYMVPYFIYPLHTITGFRFPDALNTASLGLFLSFVFALLVVIFTGWLEKKGYKLKL